MQRPDIWIERDHAGLRLTLYDKRLQYGIRATARHQPYMSEQQWIDAQLDLPRSMRPTRISATTRSSD
ncbi:hypothetical protein phiCbK_317 [Caulobacter phage phiCbK]|uniref:Uncharacterized protein n=2 Tax=Viruses TaxID=10239 RepID=J3UIA7_9CAUD|nr:hypothetical protein phiCbK_317 [Caulobacter phage phiCbK]